MVKNQKFYKIVLCSFLLSRAVLSQIVRQLKIQVLESQFALYFSRLFLL